MYKRPGKELKKHAESFVYLNTIAAAILAAFGGMILFPIFGKGPNSYEWIVFVYLGIIFGATLLTYFICRLKALQMYALGQLVDDVQTIRETFCKNAENEEIKLDM